MKYMFAALLAGGLATACTTPPAPTETTSLAPAEAAAAGAPVALFDYTSVFGQDDRPAADYAQYEVRKSKEVLAFTAILPGVTVVDLEAGGGTYTELFSRVAGDSGKVYMQNPPAFDAFLGDAVSKRVDGRLANVTPVRAPFDDLSAIPDASADLVTWLLGPHELWYTPEETAFAEIARVTKPGGHFIALDHMAPVGAPATTGGETHRIDKAIIIAMAEANGFTLVEESDILANAEDDGSLNVFDPSIRRKTNRFLLKFTKG